MKKKLLAGLAFGVMMAGMALHSSNANATLLDFEDLAGGTTDLIIPSGYGGLTWDTGAPDYYGGTDGAWHSYSDLTYSTPHSGNTYLFNAYGPSNLGFNFVSSVNSVDAWFTKTTNNTNPSPIQLIGYVGSTETYFSSLLTLNQTPQNLSITGDGITRVVVRGSDNGWYTMDDLQFGSAPVPEPATMLLFGTGLAGLIGARLRRKK